MDEPIDLNNYSVDFYFNFVDQTTNRPKTIDPRIGSFRLRKGEVVFENGVFEKFETKPIEYHEVDMETDNKAASLMPYFKGLK